MKPEEIVSWLRLGGSPLVWALSIVMGMASVPALALIPWVLPAITEMRAIVGGVGLAIFAVCLWLLVINAVLAGLRIIRKHLSTKQSQQRQEAEAQTAARRAQEQRAARYADLDDLERLLLRVFVDRGIVSISADDFVSHMAALEDPAAPLVGEDVRDALRRLSTRRMLSLSWTRDEWRIDRTVLSELAANPTLIGSPAPLRNL